MEAKQKIHNTVQFARKEKHFITDSDVESEVEMSGNQNHSTIPSKTSSAVRCEGDSASSINTSILDDTEEIKILKEKLADSEFKCKYIETENDKLNTDLNNERSRNQKLEKKLQFVKDNQEVFMRLKEAYINMKYNEAAGRKMIEIREKGLQTWEGILCKGCIEAEEMRRQIEAVRETYSNSFVIAPYEMEQILNTVKYMKDLIERREKSWTENLERDIKLQTQIQALENENTTLRELIKNKKMSTEEAKPVESQPQLQTYKETSQLKKIIVKFEKKFREVENSHVGDPSLLVSTLNDKEKKIVQLLMTKYNLRQQTKKSNEKIRSRSISRGPNREIQSILKSGNTNIKIKLPRKDDHLLDNMGFKCDKNADTAIMMMDHLFESEHKIRA